MDFKQFTALNGEDTMHRINFSLIAILFFSLSYNLSSDEEKERGGIEEITVTAEKRTSTVSDTSMSITAFDASLIEDLGMQGANDLMDQLPATTRDAYDVRIRGVGRNFRALGGDPGVATYYNGIYSPDFGIAAGESYLYDVERIEVLRGPQGTLYGRNSIGGAINYITKQPTFEAEGEVRAVLGDYGTEQYYFMSSAPLTDTLAYRVAGMTSDRDGLQKNVGTGPDTDSLDDENIALTLLWNINDDMSFQIRANDRLSDRIIGNRVLVTEGYGANRGTRNTTDPVYGLRPVSASTPGAIKFENTITGVVGYGAPRRPGVDIIGFPYRYNPMFGRSDAPSVIGTFDVDINYDQNCEDFPYGPPACNSNRERFEHTGQQAKYTWDINDTMTLTYLYGSVDYNYDFNIDQDETNNDTFSMYRVTVREDVHMTTHEVNLNWMIGDDIEVTSGAFFMDENRQQTYSLANNAPYILNPANYGVLDMPWGTVAAATGIELALPGLPHIPSMTMMSLFGATNPYGTWATAPHVDETSGILGRTVSGRWGGDPLGRVYRHKNEVQNDAYAVFTQGTWQMNDEFALTLGVRYAEDDKSALENAGGYTELFANTLAPYLPVLNLMTGAPFAAIGSQGVTALAATNVAMGAASYNYDPALVAQWTAAAQAGLIPAAAIFSLAIDPNNPITPTCDITASSCATPLRLGQGIPYSYTRLVGAEDTWSDTNFRINLDYEPDENTLWYFSVTTGYRAGGYALGVSGQYDSQRDEFGTPIGDNQRLVSYDKETVEAVEIGYKGLHLDETLQVFASIYQYDYDGYQDELQQFDPIRGAGANFVSNADGITNTGFEIELYYAATDRLTLSGNFSYTETEYGEDYFVFTVDDPINPVPVFGTFTQGFVSAQVTDPSQASDYTVNLKGGPLKGIPEEKATIRVSYEQDTRFGPLYYLLSHSYTGDFSASGIQRPLDRIDSRETTNLNISWYSQDGNLSLRAYVDNLFDNDNYYALSTGDHETNYRKSVTALPPRVMGLDIRYRF